MKACVILALLGLSSAQQGDKADKSQPAYEASTKPLYTAEEYKKKECTKDTDCAALTNGVIKIGACLQHMWKYNEQHEAAKGCWDISLCNNANGNSSYTMFDDRKIQWFCTDDQKKLAVTNTSPLDSFTATTGQYRALKPVSA